MMKAFAILPFALTLAACGAEDNKPVQTGDSPAPVTETPASTPEQSPDSTPEQNPDSTPEQNPDSTSEQNSDSNPEQNPDSTSEQNPDSTSEQNPDSTPEQIDEPTNTDSPDKPQLYSITSVTSSGGIISPTSLDNIEAAQNVEFLITPHTGFEIKEVSGCNGTLHQQTYTTGPVNEDCVISALFSPKIYTVTTSVSPGGSTSAKPTTKIEHGSRLSVIPTPNSGYHLNTMTGCNGEFSDDAYLTAPIVNDCTIDVTFEPEQYTVTLAKTPGGSIAPALPATYTHGQTVSWSITTDDGYEIASVTGCDGTLENNTYTTSALISDCTITAVFEINTYIIRPYANSGGTVEPYTDVTLAHGETATYQVLPSQYYYLKSISGCDGTLDGQTYTVGPAKAHCRFTATFERIKYSITPDLGFGGSITPASVQSIYPYSFAIFTIQPDIGYKIDDVSGCPGERSGNRIKVTDMTGDCSLTVTFERITAPARLNDTGVNWSGDNLNDNNIDCTSDLPGGQDCNAGRDALNAAGFLVKTGAGSAGFDYTKLDEQGLALPEDAEEWSCVRDNHTGLEWEVKTDTGPRAKSDTFRWYNTTLYENGGNDGDPGSDYEGCYGFDPANTLALCNTQAYVSRINATGLCGHSDWRLPDIDELRSIVDFGRTNPTIDTDYFPNTMPTIYWSSSPSTWYGTSPHPENSVYAWALDFNRGFDTQAYPPRGKHVRLVRRHSGYD